MIKKIVNIWNRIIDKLLRSYRKLSFEAYTNSRAENLSVLGKIYVRNCHVRLGKNVTLYPGVMFQGEGDIYIGDNTFIGNNTIIYSEKGYKVIIEKNCMIAAMCHIINTDHKMEKTDLLMIQQGTESANIVIKENVWLASNCTILKGVTIEEGAVIAAKALVNKNVEGESIYGGIPAKKIRKR